MKKTYSLLVLLAAAIAVSCSDDTMGQQENSLQANETGPMPINFSAYTSRGLTRSGAVGSLTTAKLTDTNSDFGKAGFGVFAYYTNADDYASDVRPNFMFNQQVKWNGTYSLFDYSPVRYWPNEYGETAKSEDIDKVSFFAYAPYLEVNPATGYLKDAGNYNEGAGWGITGTSRNTYTGDPLVKYITSFETEKSVDLCWGVYNEGEDGWTIMNGHQTITNGLPWLNVQRSGKVAQRLKFTFSHATAKLNVQIDANVDGGGNGTELGTHYGTGDSEANPVVDPIKDDEGTTKIYVRSITFTGIAQQGALNLNNVKANVPLWMNYTGTGWIENGQSVTIHDGLRDGYEGTESAEANSETVRGLNPYLISNEGNTMPGVTNTTVNLFGRYADNTDLNEGIYVIPTGERVRMTIVYDVETAVPDLPGYLSDGETHGISIENRISTDLKSDSRNLTFEGGKSYTLKLHLGMNSVKFDATVNETWDVVDDISVPRDGVALSNITQTDINDNRGTDTKPRAWVICEAGHVHLCEGGYEVDPNEKSTTYYLTWDGNAEHPTTKSTTKDDANPLSCHNKKVAVVCYVNSTGSVDKSTVVSGTSFRGLAIALEDAGSECDWFTTNSEHCASTYTIPDNKKIATNEILHLKGIDYTNQLGNATGDCEGHTHAAAQQVLAYSSGAATGTYISRVAPTGMSQWFMPTIGQWSMIVQGLSGDATGLYSATANANYKYDALNKYIETAAGGTGLSEYPYWACTEWEDSSSDHFAWTIDFEKGYGTHCNKAPVTSKPLVRPIIAF